MLRSVLRRPLRCGLANTAVPIGFESSATAARVRRPDRGAPLYWFYVNPNGAMWDLHADQAAKVVDRDRNGVEAAAAGWVAEVRVPFAAMGLNSRRRHGPSTCAAARSAARPKRCSHQPSVRTTPDGFGVMTLTR